MAFRYIAANDHPDHDTIATFRRRFLKEIEGLFVRVLLLAREMGVLKMGTVGLDGTKIHANASRHSALSWEHASKLEAQLKAEVADLLARAEAADEADVPDGMSIPEELALREKRLAKLAEARAKIEARAKERYERERAEHEAKLAERAAKTAATGKKPGGKPPAPPVEGPLPKDQINLTDEDSRIMPAAGGGFEQAYNAQAVWPQVPARSLRPMWFRRRTTSSSSNRCSTRSRLCPNTWAPSKQCWRTPAISARRMSKLAERRASNAILWPSRSIPRFERFDTGARPGQFDADRGHGPSAEDARRPQALRFQQAMPSRFAQQMRGARFPQFSCGSRQSARRVEPPDLGWI